MYYNLYSPGFLRFIKNLTFNVPDQNHDDDDDDERECNDQHSSNTWNHFFFFDKRFYIDVIAIKKHDVSLLIDCAVELKSTLNRYKFIKN